MGTGVGPCISVKREFWVTGNHERCEYNTIYWLKKEIQNVDLILIERGDVTQSFIYIILLDFYTTTDCSNLFQSSLWRKRKLWLREGKWLFKVKPPNKWWNQNGMCLQTFYSCFSLPSITFLPIRFVLFSFRSFLTSLDPSGASLSFFQESP